MYWGCATRNNRTVWTIFSVIVGIGIAILGVGTVRNLNADNCASTISYCLRKYPNQTSYCNSTANCDPDRQTLLTIIGSAVVAGGCLVCIYFFFSTAPENMPAQSPFAGMTPMQVYPSPMDPPGPAGYPQQALPYPPPGQYPYPYPPAPPGQGQYPYPYPPGPAVVQGTPVYPQQAEARQQQQPSGSRLPEGEPKP